MPEPSKQTIHHHLTSDPWAITQAGLDKIQGAADEAGTVQAILARQGVTPQDSELTTIRDGVAVIQVVGPIFHYANFLTWLFDLPSAEGVVQELQAAIDNPDVDSIVLQIDSPGGQVGGISELAGYIRERNDKPIVAYVGDMAASAAYWIASAADEIVVADTAELGSIGVVFSLRRRSDDSLEIVSTASPRKRPDPETDEGRRQIQARADNIAEVFINAVMDNRDLTREQVVSLEGDVAIARDAIELGLADRLGSLEGLIAELTATSNGGLYMPQLTLEQFKTDHAELFEQAVEAGRAEIRPQIDEARSAGDQAGRDHVLGMVEAVLGQESKAKLDQVLATGMTVEQVAAARDLFGQAPAEPQPGQGSATHQQILDGIAAASPDPAPAAQGDQVEPQDFEAAVQAYMDEHKVTKGQAVKAVSAKHPKLHQAWIDQVNQG